ncbi:SHOCT domain-containing protein [Ihubacter sp. mB4P-1]|uniref:SHOCT domain-containing protein n=1 Tax=Ihubacter sp. mB4P-1 TaxID=3242370 RepID=UPI003C7B84EF
MGKKYYNSWGVVVSGEYKGKYIHSFKDGVYFLTDFERVCRQNYVAYRNDSKSLERGTGWFRDDTKKLVWQDNEAALREFVSCAPNLSNKTLCKLKLLTSTSIGPSTSSFIKGTVIGGATLGATAALASMGSAYSVVATFKNGKESVIRFNHPQNYQKFIEEFYHLVHTSNDSKGNSLVADEILKLKKLLDQNIITQDEFDAKKKQLLE